MGKKGSKRGPSANSRNNPLFELAGYHYRAIELRYEGNTFKDISGTIGMEFRKGIHPDTIRKWFARGGLLAEQYLDYARQENDQRRQLMREELKKLTGRIPQKIEKLLDRLDERDQPDMVVVQTIKLLVDILGLSGDDDPKTGDILGNYFRRLEAHATPKPPGEA